MKTTIFLFHPSLNNSSRVNLALSKRAKSSNIQVRDMYELYPDNNINVKEEQRVLENTDRIVLQFPMFWFSSPSLLKKWEDLVLEHGWAYGTHGNALKDKELIITISIGSDINKYGHDNHFKYTITDFLRPFQATSKAIGTKFIKPFIVEGSINLSDDDINKQAAKYVEYLKDNSLEELDVYE